MSGITYPSESLSESPLGTASYAFNKCVAVSKQLGALTNGKLSGALDLDSLSLRRLSGTSNTVDGSESLTEGGADTVFVRHALVDFEGAKPSA